MLRKRGTKRVIEQLEMRLLLDAVPVGPEFRVSTWTTDHQHSASIAMDAAGRFVIAWASSEQDGSSYGVYAKRLNVQGQELPPPPGVAVGEGNEFRVNTHTTNAQRSPSVAMDADGSFLIVWESSGQDGSGYGVYAKRYNAHGEELAPPPGVAVGEGNEFRVNTFSTLSQQLPSVAMDAEGNFVIAWANQLGGYVYAKRYDSAGQELMPPPEVAVGLGNEFRVTARAGSYPSVAIDADGDFVIAWEDGVNAPDGVYAKRYNSQGHELTPPSGIPVGTSNEFRVNTYTSGLQRIPSVAMDPEGQFIISWMSGYQDGSSGGVYAKRYNLRGQEVAPPPGVTRGFGNEFRVNTYTTSNQWDPSIAFDSAGDFIITWRSRYQDGSDFGVHAKRYDAQGRELPPLSGVPLGLGNEFRVNTHTNGSQDQASVVMDADGDFIVTWRDAGLDGSSSGIYAQRYAVMPAVDVSTFEHVSAPHFVQFTFTRDVSGSLDTDDILLENLTTNQTIPASDLSLVYGPATNTATFAYTGADGSIPGVFHDGNYRATLLAAGISTAVGAALAANHEFDFFFLRGDANHDGTVNLADFNTLAANFGQSGRDFTQGDFNYDTIVNLADFNILAGRFGTSLGPAGRSFGAVPISSSSSREAVDGQDDEDESVVI